MSIHVTVDPELCIGSGDCARLLPEAFEVSDELGVSVPLPAAATTDPQLLVKAAVQCPTQAIRLVDEDGSVLHESN